MLQLEGRIVEELFSDKDDSSVTVISRCDIAPKDPKGGGVLDRRGMAVVQTATVWFLNTHRHIVKYQEFADTWLLAQMLKS